MYLIPQMIWVAGLVRQSLPTLAIFEPGKACGMPVRPRARVRRVHLPHALAHDDVVEAVELIGAVPEFVLQDLPSDLLGIGDPWLVTAVLAAPASRAAFSSAAFFAAAASSALILACWAAIALVSRPSDVARLAACLAAMSFARASSRFPRVLAATRSAASWSPAGRAGCHIGDVDD